MIAAVVVIGTVPIAAAVAAIAVVASSAHVQCCCTAERFDRRRSPGPHDRWAPPGMRMADAPFAVPRSTSSTAGTSAFRPMKHGPAAAAHRRRMVSSHAHQEESRRALCCRVQMLPELHLPPEMANSAPPRGRSADPNRRTTCSTGAESDRITRMRWSEVPREASRDLPGRCEWWGERQSEYVIGAVAQQ